MQSRVWAPQNQLTWSKEFYGFGGNDDDDDDDNERVVSWDELTTWLHRVLLVSILPPNRSQFELPNQMKSVWQILPYSCGCVHFALRY